jgi:oligopeptide/dipeptide ABC transporter ATP-binding protein
MSAASGPQSTAIEEPPSLEPLLDVRDLAVHFRSAGVGSRRRHAQTLRAIDGLNLVVNRGESVAVVGESGSGKTTLGRVICRLQGPTAGSVFFKGQGLATLKGKELEAYHKAVQMVFQDPYASLDPRLLIRSIVGEPLEINRMGGRKERRESVRHLLQLVGLRAEFAERYPHELSGGQRQRVAIARALASSPELIVADEPTSALDVSAQAQILNLIHSLRETLGLAIVYITHNLPTVRYVSDRTIVMYLGRVMESGPTGIVLMDSGHPYTRSLLASAPSVDAVESSRREFLVPGDPPDPAAPPSGCRFHTRCWWRQRLGGPEDCVTVEPAIPAGDHGHAVACHHTDEMRRELRQARREG